MFNSSMSKERFFKVYSPFKKETFDDDQQFNFTSISNKTMKILIKITFGQGLFDD